MSVLDAILAHVQSLAPGVPVRSDTSLLDELALNSLTLLEIATFLESEFGLELERADMDLTNFGTPRQIAELVERKRR